MFESSSLSSSGSGSGSSGGLGIGPCVVRSCLRFLLYFVPSASTKYDLGPTGFMQTAGVRPVLPGLFILTVSPGSSGGRAFVFRLYHLACFPLACCIRCFTSSVGTVAGFNREGDVGSLVFVLLPNSSCTGDACTFSKGVFPTSSRAR